MPAPSGPEYSVAALVAAHTALLALIDTGSGNGTVKIRTSADALLATINLDDPAGTVNGTTGQLTLDPDNVPNASATGTAAYGQVCDVAGNVVLALPASAGSSAVEGEIVINTLALVSGTPVEILSITIG